MPGQLFANVSIRAQNSIENAPLSRSPASSGTVKLPVTPSNDVAVSASRASAPAAPLTTPPAKVPPRPLPDASAAVAERSPRRQYAIGLSASTESAYGGAVAVGVGVGPGLGGVVDPVVTTSC